MEEKALSMLISRFPLSIGDSLMVIRRRYAALKEDCSQEVSPPSSMI